VNAKLAVVREIVVRAQSVVHHICHPFHRCRQQWRVAFTADITGCRRSRIYATRISQLHDGAIGPGTRPAGLQAEDLQLKEFDTFGRKVGYATSKTEQETLVNWLRQNPHGLHLGAWARLEKGRWHRDPGRPEERPQRLDALEWWWKAC